MVIQTLGRPKRNFANQIMAGIGGGLNVASEMMGQQQMKQQQQQENEQIKKLTGLDLSGIQDPHTRSQLIADQLAFGRKMKQAQGSSGINPVITDYVEKETPSKAQQPRVPTIKKEKTTEISTKGEKLPELNPEQVWNKGQEIAQQYRNQNIPMSDEEGFSLANAMNNENIAYNQKQQNQIESFGNLGQEAIERLYPEASPELISIFRGYGEDESTKASPAEARKVVAQKAEQFKNKISAIGKNIGPRRLISGVVQDISGTGREEEKVRRSLRQSLKPLHDLGLFDMERNLLSGLGYYPEEIESTITDLSENAQKVVAQLPQIKKGTPQTEKLKKAKSLSLGMGAGAGPSPGISKEAEEYSKNDLEKINNSIRSAINSDPNVNLILLRKAYSGKNVDWSIFKDVLDDMVINGEIILNPDQQKAYDDVLNQPALTTLGKILKGLNLGGI